jgi:hypothetical protein
MTGSMTPNPAATSCLLDVTGHALTGTVYGYQLSLGAARKLQLASYGYDEMG